MNVITEQKKKTKKKYCKKYRKRSKSNEKRKTNLIYLINSGTEKYTFLTKNVHC